MTMFSFVFGFLSGTAVGIYLSQNYEVPDMNKLMETLKDSAKKLEKKDGSPKTES